MSLGNGFPDMVIMVLPTVTESKKRGTKGLSTSRHRTSKPAAGSGAKDLQEKASPWEFRLSSQEESVTRNWIDVLRSSHWAAGLPSKP